MKLKITTFAGLAILFLLACFSVAVFALASQGSEKLVKWSPPADLKLVTMKVTSFSEVTGPKGLTVRHIMGMRLYEVTFTDGKKDEIIFAKDQETSFLRDAKSGTVTASYSKHGIFYPDIRTVGSAMKVGMKDPWKMRAFVAFALIGKLIHPESSFIAPAPDPSRE